MDLCLTFGYLMSEMYIEEEMLLKKQANRDKLYFLFCKIDSSNRKDYGSCKDGAFPCTFTWFHNLVQERNVCCSD